MDFPVNDDGVGALSYQRRYNMTQQQRINRFRQQRNFRSLRDPPYNYSGTSTYERETEDDEQQALMRPTTPTPPMGLKSRRVWSPDTDRQSSQSSWRGSSSFGISRDHQQPPPPQQPYYVQTRQPMLYRGIAGGTGSSNNSSRSREDVVVVENCVSAPTPPPNNQANQQSSRECKNPQPPTTTSTRNEMRERDVKREIGNVFR